jgi:hypothetical protein
VAHVPDGPEVVKKLLKTGKVADCRDVGAPMLASSAVPGACRTLGRMVHVKWDSGEAVDANFVYSCMPVMNLEYADLEKVVVQPSK